eukprot:RCo006278
MSAEELRKRAAEWVAMDPCAETRKEVEALLERDDQAELHSGFARRITFGTAGLRAKVAAGPAFMNELVVLQTAQGLAKFLQESFSAESLQSRGIVIGHDHRRSSHRFAVVSAAVMLQAGLRVLLMGEPLPTPFVPWGVRHTHALAGVMVTASHNPKEDNGYKVYWRNTAQIVSPMDRQIQKLILENLTPWTAYDLSEAAVVPRTFDCTDSVLKSYFSSARLQCCLVKPKDLPRRSVAAYLAAATGEDDEEEPEDPEGKPPQPVFPDCGLRVAYTAMHGVGTVHAQRIWSTFRLPGELSLVRSQCAPDPDFSTVPFPNPEEAGALRLACEHADRNACSLVFATDPDADRFACAVKDGDPPGWRVLSGNDIALLMADWIWQHYSAEETDPGRRSKAVMLASTVSSKVLKRMAEKEGFLFVETLTGFKWLGNRAAELIAQGHDFLFAYEVEIGYAIGEMTHDKDGIRTLGAFAQLAFSLASQQITLLQRLAALYERYGHHKMLNSYFFSPTPEAMAAVFAHVRGLFRADASFAPFTIGASGRSFTVTHVRDLTQGFDSGTADHKPVLPVDPSTHMLTFTFEDGSVCTLRGSGTEPKLKYYIETVSSCEKDAEKALGELAVAVVENLLRPSDFQLTAPAS